MMKAMLKLIVAALVALFWASPVTLTAGTKVVVQLDWIPNAQFAGLLVAKERGWYADAGLDVEIVPVDQKTLDPVTPVTAANNVVGCADGLALLRARAEGKPIKAFATMLQASPLGIIALRGRGVEKLADLAGKTIGLHAYDRPQLAIMLAGAGLKLEDVKVKEIGDDTASLPAGVIDAQVVYLIDEKVALETRGISLNVFPGYEHGYLTYSQVYFAREDFLKDQPEVLRSFLAASNRGWQEALGEPEATAGMLVAKYVPGTDPEYQKRTIQELQRFATRESPELGQMRAATWEASCALFHLDAALAGQLADYSILTALYGPP